tara:strand:+ start:22213 stop:22608 length:396 start_codon:yes stop_codon:yes gene_type:complete
MNKKKQIWYRYNNDTKKLKTECVDLLSKCYLMLGQKPDTQQVVLMSQLLYDDLINNYSRFTMQEVIFAFEQAIKHSDNGNFVNVRNWNIWLKEYKEKARIKRQQNLLTDYQQHEKNIKLIGKTINKAKHLK